MAHSATSAKTLLIPLLALLATSGCGGKGSPTSSAPPTGARLSPSAPDPSPSYAAPDNSTAMGACRLLVAALAEGDREAIETLNHSPQWEFPTDYLMSEFSPVFQAAANKGFKFGQKDDRTILVKFPPAPPGTIGYAAKEVWTFVFLKEKKGYFFVKLH